MAYPIYPVFPEPRQGFDPVLDDKHDTLFIDPEKALDYLGPDQRRAVDGWLSTSEDRPKDLRYAAMKGYLTDVFREPNPTSERVDVLKNNYAWSRGLAPVGAHVDDDVWFDLVKQEREFNRGRKTLAVDIHRKAYEAALSIDPTFSEKRKAEIFNGFTADGDGNTGYSPYDLANLYRIWNDTTERVKFESIPLQSAAREIADLLKKDYGSVMFDYMLPAVDRLMKIPKDKRDLTLEFVRQEFSKGGGEQVGLGLPGEKRNMRLMEGIGEGLARGVQDVTDKLTAYGERQLESLGARNDAEWRANRDKMRSLVNGTLHPLTADNMITQGFFGAAQSLPAMGMIAAGPVGAALSVTYYQQGSYDKFKADPAFAKVPDSKVATMALLSGTAQAALDRLELGILSRLPGASKVVEGLSHVANPLRYVTGESAKFIAGTALETGVEVLQDHYADVVTQQVASWISSDIDRPDWAKANAEAMRALPELTMTMIPLMAFATAAGGIRDVHAARALATTPELLRAAGFGAEQANAIVTSENPVSTLRALWPERDPMKGAPAGASPAAVAAKSWEDLKARMEAEHKDATGLPQTDGVAYVQRTGDGWQVVEDNGQTHTLPTSEAAADMIHAIGLASTQREASAMASIADELDARRSGMEQRLSGDTVKGNAAGEVSVTRGDTVTMRSAGQSAAELARELQQAGYAAGDWGVIQGSNWIAQDGTRISAVNKGSAPVFTQVHEFAEMRFKEIVDADGGASAVAAARVVAPLFDPAKATNPADKAFAERLQSIAAGRVNGTPEEVETAVRETMIDLVVADTLGQRKDGSRLPAGAVSNAILDRIRMYGRSEQAAREADVANGAQLPLLQKFAGILKAVRHYLRGVFTVAAKLQKARRDGVLKDGDDFNTFADKLLGLDTVKAHQAEVVREAGRGETFSVQPATGGSVTPQQDAEYMAAVESGDVEKQQAMVDAAAKAWIETAPRIAPGDESDGRTVLEDVPNKSSISATLDDWQDFGIRDVPYGWVVGTKGREPRLAEAINESGEISPLIIVVDGHPDGPAYVLEGAHRIDALATLGAKSLPALVVYDKSADPITRDESGNIIPLSVRFPTRKSPGTPANAGQTFSVQPATGGSVTPQQDAEYMAAVESGDVEKQQAMVDAAAKAAGLNGPWLHGSNVEFASFDESKAGDSTGGIGTGRAWFFTSDAVLAGQRGGVVRGFFIDLRGDGSEHDMSEIDDGGREFDRIIKNAATALDEWVLFTDALDRTDGVRSDILAVIFHPEKSVANKIKSADPIARDESGNVIPLSVRFPTRKSPGTLANAGAVSLPESGSDSFQSAPVSGRRENGTDNQGGVNPDSASFSIGSVNTLEAIAAQFEERLAAGGPAAKLEAYADTARTLEGMARAARSNEETEKILKVGEIETERRALQKRLEDEYILQVWQSPAGGALNDEESAQLKSNPLIQQIIRPLQGKEKGISGRLLSPARAKREGKRLAGEYEDALNRGLPGWLFRGDRTPDQMASELGMDVPEMWAAIESALDSTAKQRAALAKAKEQIAEAKDRARTEAREWANKERWKLSTSDVRDSRRAIVTLDAMLMHLPAEVRGRVGGFTAITDLKSNDARRRHFLKMIDRIDAALEDYLRKEYIKGIREVLDKGQAKKAYGEKDRGKLGVNAHTWLETAQAVMAMGETRLSERESHIDAILGGKEMTAAEIADLNRAWDMGTGEDAARMALEVEQGILDLFGGITHREDGRYIRTAGEIEAALKAARETVETGRQAWDKVLLERRERRAGRRAGVKVDSGNAGGLADIAEREKAMQGFGGAATKYFRKGFDFQSFIGDIFGRGSDTHLWAESVVNDATLTGSALWQQSQRDLTEFLKTLWPRTGVAGRLRNLENLSTPRKVPGAEDRTPQMSEMQAVHMTMLWADEGSRGWLRKHHLGDGEPLDPQDEKGVDVQAALEAFLSPQAKAIRTWLQDRYDAQYDTLNDVYRRIHGVNMPRVRNYAPRMVEHGKDAIVIDPLGSGGMSARGVFAGFTKRRRPDVSAAPVAADALQAFTQNQRVVSHFVAWAEASSDLRAVFSTSDTAPFIKAAAGTAGTADLNQWLTDLDAGGVRTVQGSIAMQKFLKATVNNALVGKLAVLAKQIPAAYAAAADIGWGDYLVSARRVMIGTAARPVSGAMESRIMQARGFQRPAEIGQAASGTGATPWTAKMRRLGVDLNYVDLSLDWLGGRIGATDAWFTARGAAIAYDSHFRDGKAQKMTDTEAHAYAERETERTIMRTAQPDSVAAKSLMENHLGIYGRVLYQFQSANRQALFMTVAAFRDGGIKSKDAWNKAVTHWALTGFVVQTVGALIRDMLSDDDEEKDWRPDLKLDDYVRAMTIGPATGAGPISGSVIDAFGSLAGGFERREAASPAGAVTAVGKEMFEAFRDGESFDVKDQEVVARGLGLALRGRWAALNVAENLGKQAVGFGDNLVTTEGEAEERKAKAWREADKEARKARDAALTDEDRAALRKHREETKALRQQQDAAKWDALNP